MIRFSLRTFLIFCLVSGVVLALTLRTRWHPRARSNSFDSQVTGKGLGYRVHVLAERGPHSPNRLLSAVIVPTRTSAGWHGNNGPHPKVLDGGLTIYRDGVFLNGQLIGGLGTSKVLICLDRTDIRVIDLTEEETAALDTLDAVTPPNKISSVWRDKVEPQIDHLVDLRRNPHDRAYRQSAGLPQ
jgi:hypothetical protein